MKMRLFLLSAIVLLLAATVQADYYLTIDGQDVTEYTIEVGQSITVGVWSTDASVPSTEPTPNSAYALNAWSITAWDSDYPAISTRGSMTDMVINNANVGAEATGWTSADPYDYIVTLGFTLGSTPNPVSAGLWYEVTFTCQGQGDVILGLGFYDAAWAYTNYDELTIHQIPPGTSGTGSVLIAQWEGDYAVVEDVDKITQLYDQTANSYDMHINQYWDTEDTGDYRPIHLPDVLNGHAVVQFDGDQYLKYWSGDPNDENDENWIDAQNYTWFIVANDVYPELPQNSGGFSEQAMLVNAYRDYYDGNANDDYTYYGWGNTLLYGNYLGDVYSRTFANTEDYIGGPAQEYAEEWGIQGGTESGWRVITGVWDAPDANSVLIDGDIDTYRDYSKGSDSPPYYEDNPSTDYLSNHYGTYLGSLYEDGGAGTPQRYTGQIAEVRIYRGAMDIVEISDEVQDLRVKYGLESGQTCTDLDDLALLCQHWLNTVKNLWEEDMSVDPVTGGQWAVRGTADNYTMSGGKMVLGSSGWSTLVDSQPGSRFDCQTEVTVDFHATQNLTSGSGAEGIGLYVNVGDADNVPFGNLLFEAHMVSSSSQEVRIWDAGTNTLLHTFSGFGTGMIHLEFTVDVKALEITVHTITDGSITDSAVIPFGLNGVFAGYPYVTITTLNEPGEIDYINVIGTHDDVSQVDSTSDCKVDLEDFADLAMNWNPLCN